jgi:hypothetical protein
VRKLEGYEGQNYYEEAQRENFLHSA